MEKQVITGTDALKEAAQFAGLKVLDVFVDALEKMTFTIAGYIRDGIESVLICINRDKR